MRTTLPISLVLATRNRPEPLRRTLNSIFTQSSIPREIVIVDGSENSDSEQVVFTHQGGDHQKAKVLYVRAAGVGAAAQRNEGLSLVTEPFVLFCDDDIVLEEGCLQELWHCINLSPRIGGASALITNQQYGKPGRVSRLIFGLMAGKRATSYAGRIIGPAVNLLPSGELNPFGYNRVDWLYTTCVLYRTVALPNPVFDLHFRGYSLMEDLTLSLRVSANWLLINVPTAKIFHDSQPGDHKSDARARSKMELVNRHYVVYEVMLQRGAVIAMRFLAWELFQLLNSARSKNGVAAFVSSSLGKVDALVEICRK
jgi:glycosyltransferase involved in cell wall biosynthesis